MNNSPEQHRIIAVAKDKVKRLHSILKPRIPEIKLSECFEYYSRMEGSRNWNTHRAILKANPTAKNRYKKLITFIDDILRPMVIKIGSAHGMEVVTSPGAYFMEVTNGDETVANSSPSNKIDLTFRPKNQSNTDYNFRIKIAPKEISAWTNEITFIFPEDFSDIPLSVLAGKRIPHEITARVLRDIDRGVPNYSLILETGPILEGTKGSQEIWDIDDKVEYVRANMDEAVGKYAKLNIAFQKLSKHWNNKKLLSSFETALWEVFTGTPRFMSASPDFYSASFGDMTLTAYMDKWGPSIVGGGGSLNLGVSSIIYCEADGKKLEGYYIAKYGNRHEALIYLKGIAKEDVLKITSEFGVPPDFELAQELGVPLDEIPDDYSAFFRSRAFVGLQEWVSRNRSFAKQIRRGAVYIPDWYERATGQHPIPDSDHELSEQGRATRHSKLRKAAIKGGRT